MNSAARSDVLPVRLITVRLAEKDFKITALTHELAYYRRIRFGKASEALAGEQRLLFEETVDMDLAAIEWASGAGASGSVPTFRHQLCGKDIPAASDSTSTI